MRKRKREREKRRNISETGIKKKRWGEKRTIKKGERNRRQKEGGR